MAARRSFDAGGERDMNDDEGLGFMGNPRGDFGWSSDLSPDDLARLQADQQQGIFDTPVAGDTTTGREMFDRQPLTPAVRQAPSIDYAGGLPQGMTVDEGYGGGGDQDAFSTPAMAHEPNPIAGMRPNPQIAPQATRRVSSPGSQSALFGDDSGGQPMFGRAGGLLGGGKGVLGANEGGPTPTDMMLSLLRMLRNGA